MVTYTMTNEHSNANYADSSTNVGGAGEAEPKDCNCSPQKRHDEDCVTCS